MYFVTSLSTVLTTGNSCTTAANFHTITYLRQDICINRLQQKMLVNLFRCNLRTSGKSLCSCVVQLLSMYIRKSSSIVHINVRRQAHYTVNMLPKENTAPCGLHSPQLQCRIPATDVLGKQNIWLSDSNSHWNGMQEWTMWQPLWMRSPFTWRLSRTMAIVGRSVSTGCGPWKTQQVWHVMRYLFTFTLNLSNNQSKSQMSIGSVCDVMDQPCLFQCIQCLCSLSFG